jgi:hypothetical protein
MTSGLFKTTVIPSAKLKAFQREWPAKLSRAMTMVVNGVAFDMRGEMESSIGRLMTIRSKGFVKRHLWVQKARGGSHPVAEVGSIKRGKFEGWAGQQFGESVDRTRVPTLMARGGAKRKAMKNAARLMKGRDVPTASDIAGKSGPGSVIAMMRILARRGDRRPFLIHADEHPRFKGGLYEMRGRKDKGGRKAKLHMLQGLENPNTQPSRLDWVNPAWRAYQKSRSIAGEWRKAFNMVGWQDVMRRAR